ncbi:MAG: NACHT domain-containing protein [Anaerolineales bacterium]|nr:NACHT domain-containing protein [Anaerolineales bacterium]
MVVPVLATKLFIPPSPPKVVIRSRLLGQLDAGLHHKLIVISAPAGFGKSTLVSEWIAGCGRPTAWLSLDENDNDVTRFLIYCIGALQTISPKLGTELLSALQSSQIPPIETVLTALLNEITTIPTEFIFVLDDYHLTDAKSVDDALSFLIDHLPPQMHLVITTREDPSLPIPRLRARNQLTEIRAADLRFTPSEAAEFLNQVMNLDLSVEDVAVLETRTEGWIAGLQLAALSMKGQQDVHGFIQTFAGDHRYIVDYLVEEVLQRQPEEIRDFLLQTSILERLNGSLCDAVAAQAGSKSKLEQLQRGNLFLIPLDDKREWYRYHHLFADVLRMHLTAEQPDLVPTLHHRASEWYEKNDLVADAIQHALIGADFERAANLIEMVAPTMHRHRQETILLGWMKSLPEKLFRNRPVLSIAFVGTIMSSGEIEGVEVRLQDAERWQDIVVNGSERPKDMVVMNEDEFRRLPGSIALYRAAKSLALGNLPDAVTYAQRVFKLMPEDDQLGRGAAAALLGLTFWVSGDLEDAYRLFADGMSHLRIAGNISDAVGGVLALADIRITQGRLHDAMQIYEQALQLAKENGTPTIRGTADMYVGMSELEREYNDLHAATQHLLRSQKQGEHTGFPRHPYRWRVAMARIKETQGDLQGAIELLDEAEPLFVSDFFPNVHPIASLKARVWIKQGELEKALAWARERKLSVDESPSYLREFEQITFARILLAQYQSVPSISLLERLLKAAEEGGRVNSVIEILILQAFAYQMQEDIPAALSSLERALKLAEPEGYMRIFLTEGSNMAELIREIAKRGFLPSYTSKLVSAFEAERKGLEVETLPSATPASSSMIEPLSQRELDILRLFKTELSGPEIAQELVIALSTVRTHTKSIYNKLSVNSRRAAVKRANELGLI